MEPGHLEGARSARPMPSIADKAAAAPARLADAVARSSEMCFECATVGLGRVDDLDGNFYCESCWTSFMAADNLVAPAHLRSGWREQDIAAEFDFWRPSPFSHGPGSLPHDHWDRGGVATGKKQQQQQQQQLDRWAHARVIELLPHDAEAFVDPDVVVCSCIALLTCTSCQASHSVYAFCACASPRLQRVQMLVCLCTV